MEISLQIATSLKSSIYFAPRLLLGCFFFSPVVKDSELQRLWEPAIETEPWYLENITLKGQWGITLNRGGTTNVTIWMTKLYVKTHEMPSFDLGQD